MEIIDLNEEQVEDIESRLSSFDENYITYKMDGCIQIGVEDDGKLIGVYTDPDIIYPNGDQAQSIVIAYELQLIGGKLFCDQDETLELKYFSKEEKPQLFTGSHEELWNEIFNQN